MTGCGAISRSAIIAYVITVQMNDAAGIAMGAFAGFDRMLPDGGIHPDLDALAHNGLSLRGEALIFADHSSWAADPPGTQPNLTAWECFVSSFHLEDYVPVKVATVDDAPVIDDDAQRILLTHGFVFALKVCQRAVEFPTPLSVRCIVAANTTNATFRFHRVRAGEYWNDPDLDRYPLEKMIVIEYRPTTA